jgi:hypothetical protein
MNSLSVDAIRSKVSEFESSPVVELVRERGGKTDTRNLKEWIEKVEFLDNCLEMSVAVTPSGSMHPLDALCAILGLSKDEIRMMKILKKSATF